MLFGHGCSLRSAMRWFDYREEIIPFHEEIILLLSSILHSSAALKRGIPYGKIASDRADESE